MKQKIFTLLIILLMLYSGIAIAGNLKTTQIKLEDNPNGLPTVNVTVNYIKELDPIEPAGNPDWYYIIEVYNGSNYRDPHSVKKEYDIKDDPDSDNSNKWTVNKKYNFKTYSCTTRIVITLKDSDPDCDDIADISSEPNKDKDPGYLSPCSQDDHGRKLCILYDIDKKNSQTIISNGEERKEEGNDGEGNSGPGEGSAHEDDAEINVTIEDNYEPISLNLEVQNRDEEFEENDNVNPEKL
jgi:hypothetical protein